MKSNRGIFFHPKAKYTAIRPISRNKEEVTIRIAELLMNEATTFNGWFIAEVSTLFTSVAKFIFVVFFGGRNKLDLHYAE